jgi:1,2-diacylglycerol-3-alpha-glucose alpha-1,2-glucosyltransferase
MFSSGKKSFFNKDTGTGLLSAYNNQKAILKRLEIPFVEKWDDACDILQVNTPWLISLHLIKKVKKQNKKVIIWTHTTAEDFMNAFRFSNLLAPLLRKYLKYVYGLADMLFCPSAYTKSILVGYGLDASKIIVQSNGVDVEKFAKNEEKGKQTIAEYKLHKPVIGCVGLVFPKRKGVDTFLYLAKEFPEYDFVWFGKVFSSFLVQALPKTLPANAKFTGYVNDIVGAYSAIDIFVFPSHEENQGMAILEAASASLPLLVRDIPAYEKDYFDGENCFKAHNDAEFKSRLEMLIKDLDLRKKFSQAARVLAEKHSLSTVAQKTLNDYKTLLKN